MTCVVELNGLLRVDLGEELARRGRKLGLVDNEVHLANDRLGLARASAAARHSENDRGGGGCNEDGGSSLGKHRCWCGCSGVEKSATIKTRGKEKHVNEGQEK